jgi:hypothetical protein
MGSKSLRRVCGISACKKDGACCSDNDRTCCPVSSWCPSQSRETRPGRRLSSSDVGANPKTTGSNGTPVPSLSSVLASAEPSSSPSACCSDDDCPGFCSCSCPVLAQSSLSIAELSVILRVELRWSWRSGESVWVAASRSCRLPDGAGGPSSPSRAAERASSSTGRAISGVVNCSGVDCAGGSGVGCGTDE